MSRSEQLVVKLFMTHLCSPTQALKSELVRVDCCLEDICEMQQACEDGWLAGEGTRGLGLGRDPGTDSHNSPSALHVGAQPGARVLARAPDTGDRFYEGAVL